MDVSVADPNKQGGDALLRDGEAGRPIISGKEFALNPGCFFLLGDFVGTFFMGDRG